MTGQTVLEVLKLLRGHMIDIERNNTDEDLKLPISAVIQSFNKVIDIEKKKEEKEKQ